jgi:hypothetical protein
MLAAQNTTKTFAFGRQNAIGRTSNYFGTSKVLKNASRVTRSASQRKSTVSVSAAVEAPAPTVAPPGVTEQAEKLLDIVFVATEVSPWSKTGAFIAKRVKRAPVCQNGSVGSTNLAHRAMVDF